MTDTESMAAMQLAAIGFQHFSLVAGATLGPGGTKRLEKTMTAATGARAVVWMAHCLGRPKRKSQATPEYQRAYEILERRLPLTPEDAAAFDQIERQFSSPSETYLHLAHYAFKIVIGADEEGLSDAGPTEANIGLVEAWRIGSRLYFRVVDLSRFADWAKAKGLPEKALRQ